MPVANVALEVTNLDFDGIKTNLKNYLKSKDTFADFDFDHWAQSRKINNFEVTKMSKARLETNCWHTCVLFSPLFM